jgi:hypothetical protein
MELSSSKQRGGPRLMSESRQSRWVTSPSPVRMFRTLSADSPARRLLKPQSSLLTRFGDA